MQLGARGDLYKRYVGSQVDTVEELSRMRVNYGEPVKLLDS
jgi:hypothetical protein